MASDKPTGEEIPNFIPEGVIPTDGYDPQNPYIFKGTEGKMNYVLVAEQGPVILGVRVLVQKFTKEKCLVGFRIRSTKHPEKDATVAPGVFGSVWGPDVQFTKNVITHSSFMMMTELNMPPGLWDELPKAMKKGRVVSKLMSWLAANIPQEALVFEQEELVEVIWNQIAKQVKIKELQGEVFAPMVGEDGQPVEATIDPNAQLTNPQQLVEKMAKEEMLAQGFIFNEDGTVTPPAQPDDAPTLEEFSGNIGEMLDALSEEDDEDSGLLPN